MKLICQFLTKVGISFIMTRLFSDSKKPWIDMLTTLPTHARSPEVI